MTMYEQVAAAWEKYVLLNAGDLTESAFRRYYPRAAAYLGSITRGRSDHLLEAALMSASAAADSTKTLQEKVLLAAFGVVEELRLLSLNDGAGPVVAETNDGISITYASGRVGLGGSGSASSGNNRSAEQRLYQAAALYLRGTGLLYRGAR